MEWSFEYNVISDNEVEVIVVYAGKAILILNSIDEEVDFFSMDMYDVEDYLIANYEEYIENDIRELNRMGIYN